MDSVSTEIPEPRASQRKDRAGDEPEKSLMFASVPPDMVGQRGDVGVGWVDRELFGVDRAMMMRPCVEVVEKGKGRNEEEEAEIRNLLVANHHHVYLCRR
jgi:hypothetical protein